MPAIGACCEALAEKIPNAMSELSELSSRVEELTTDFKSWTTTYRCKVCAAIWEERYESHGHSDVPTVVRLTRSRDSL